VAFDFTDQVAVVTGAGNGLGRSHALLLASRGAAVVVNDLGGDRNGIGVERSPADDVVAEIEAAGGTAVANYDSVATPEGAAAIIASALDSYGRLDVLVNNAGILRDKTLVNLTHDDIDAVLDVHLKGSLLVAQSAFRVMKEQRYGRLVHTTSVSGLFGNFGQSNYGAAKAGIAGLSRVIAIEGARYGITSNTVAPNARTRLNEELLGPFAECLLPEQISGTVAYLASRECSVTGEIYSAGGGRVARIFIGLTQGWFAGKGEVPTPELVAAHLDEIRAEPGYIVPTTLADEMRILAEVLELDEAST